MTNVSKRRFGFVLSAGTVDSISLDDECSQIATVESSDDDEQCQQNLASSLEQHWQDDEITQASYKNGESNGHGKSIEPKTTAFRSMECSAKEPLTSALQAETATHVFEHGLMKDRGTTCESVGRAPKLEVQEQPCIKCEAPQSGGANCVVKREAVSRIGVVKREAKQICVNHGVLTSHDELARGSELKWSVSRPAAPASADESALEGEGRKRSRPSQIPKRPARAAERAVKRFRSLTTQATGSSSRMQPILKPAHKKSGNTSTADGLAQTSALERLCSGAATQLVAVFGSGSDKLADSIARAFIEEHGIAAKHRLKSLVVALRTNVSFRKAVLQQGQSCAATVAQQNPLEWASAKLQLMRRQWVADSLREACPSGGQVSVCPECGGRAIVECGQSADFKKAKQYAHYTCMEEKCGKVTHIKE